MRKVFYYIYSEDLEGYFSGHEYFEANSVLNFLPTSNPTSHFTRFKSIKGAEKMIKTRLKNISDHLIIEDTNQVRERRREITIQYYTDLFKKIKKSFTKKEVARILGNI